MSSSIETGCLSHDLERWNKIGRQRPRCVCRVTLFLKSTLISMGLVLVVSEQRIKVAMSTQRAHFEEEVSRATKCAADAELGRLLAGNRNHARRACKTNTERTDSPWGSRIRDAQKA